MSMLKIKKGDTVKVIAGKDKDKEGKVLSVNQKDGKVVVEGVNMLTKHTKPSAANANGGIIHQEVQSTFLMLCMCTKELLQELALKWMETKKYATQNQQAK